MSYQVFIRYRNNKEDFHARLLFGNHLFYDGNQNQSYEQYIRRGTIFPKSQTWSELEIGEISVLPGQYQIRLSASLNLDGSEVGFDVDQIILRPVT